MPRRPPTINNPLIIGTYSKITKADPLFVPRVASFFVPPHARHKSGWCASMSSIGDGYHQQPHGGGAGAAGAGGDDEPVFPEYHLASSVINSFSAGRKRHYFTNVAVSSPLDGGRAEKSAAVIAVAVALLCIALCVSVRGVVWNALHALRELLLPPTPLTELTNIHALHHNQTAPVPTSCMHASSASVSASSKLCVGTVSAPDNVVKLYSFAPHSCALSFTLELKGHTKTINDISFGKAITFPLYFFSSLLLRNELNMCNAALIQFASTFPMIFVSPSRRGRKPVSADVCILGRQHCSVGRSQRWQQQQQQRRKTRRRVPEHQQQRKEARVLLVRDQWFDDRRWRRRRRLSV